MQISNNFFLFFFFLKKYCFFIQSDAEISGLKREERTVFDE